MHSMISCTCKPSCKLVMKICALLVVGVVHAFAAPPDWLITDIQDEVTLTAPDDAHLILSNGLISRTFLLTPNFGTVDFKSESGNGGAILRTLSTEGNITLDGYMYTIGGLFVPPDQRAYLNISSENIQADPYAFQYINYTKSNPAAPFHWEPGLRFSPKTSNWPPKGLHLTVNFVAPPVVRIPAHSDVFISVHYEMYQGAPILAKWISVSYESRTPIVINSVVVEYLAVQKPYAPLSYQPLPKPWDIGTGATGSWLYVEADQPYGVVIKWIQDSYLIFGANEGILVCSYYEGGPSVVLTNITTDTRYMSQFDSFKVIELVTDTDDRERVGLSRHRLTRLLAPQTQENPIFFHATNTTPDGFRAIVDQMSEVGFEMYIYSFGSGFYMENTDPKYLNIIKSNVQYAHSKGIEVGGYDLIVLTKYVQKKWSLIDPRDGKYLWSCLASGWYEELLGLITNFFKETGVSMIEADGTYGGDILACASKNHEHHFGTNDSIYWQVRLQGEMFIELKKTNVYINQPENYYYKGGNKGGMGYNEWQYNLPRMEDLTVSRQGMFDDTYDLLPTQGWMFLPIQDYHGGGIPAAFEPLEKNVLAYEWGLAQYMGYGVAACYRGNILYDGPLSKAVAKKWTSFFKSYRDILISDIVHVIRPTMQDIDAILHVNPFIENKGLAMIFNPTLFEINRDLILSLYYTGLNSTAMIYHEGEEPAKLYTLDKDYTITIPIDLQPQTITWYLIKA